MAYTKRTWSQKAKSTIVFFISVFITIVVLSAFIYAGLYVKNFAANTTLVVTPIAHIAISVGIITFIVGAYQQSIELLAKKKQALDTLNQYGWLEGEKIFMQEPALAKLYRELYLADKRSNFYPNVAAMKSDDDSNQRNAIEATMIRTRQLEYHMLSYLIQVMENVYSIGNLEERYDDSEMEGWMNTFRLWSTSNKFKTAWKLNKHLYGRDFREGVDIVIYNDINI